MSKLGTIFYNSQIAHFTCEYAEDADAPEITIDEYAVHEGMDASGALSEMFEYSHKANFILDQDQARELFNWLGAYLHGVR